MMTVDNEFLDHDPADKKDSKRGKFHEEGQLRKRNPLHDGVSKTEGVKLVPIEVRLKSRPNAGLLIGAFCAKGRHPPFCGALL